jgi:hypothetical protein
MLGHSLTFTVMASCVSRITPIPNRNKNVGTELRCGIFVHQSCSPMRTPVRISLGMPRRSWKPVSVWPRRCGTRMGPSTRPDKPVTWSSEFEIRLTFYWIIADCKIFL